MILIGLDWEKITSCVQKHFWETIISAKYALGKWCVNETIVYAKFCPLKQTTNDGLVVKGQDS